MPTVPERKRLFRGRGAGHPTRVTSLWLDREPETTYPALEPGLRFDAVVVGGGLTGVTTALLLARAGVAVALLEARHLGFVATGNTTAKLSVLQGTHLSEIARRHSTDVVRAYVDANREGQQWLLRFCADNDVVTQSQPAFTYAQTPDGVARVRAERDACRASGVVVDWVDRPDVPFPAYGAIRLADQAQFDPMAVLHALAADACRHGAVIFENTRVVGVHGTVIRSDRGEISADRVILATGTPILDRGGFFARLEPNRSYALAFDGANPIPDGMYLSADEPTRSVRYAPNGSAPLLLVGGNGHVVGRATSPRAKIDELGAWTRTYWPDATLTHSWSAQDYSPADGLPYVGPLLPGSDRILVATGYAKWGMTNGVAAALALSGRILGGRMDWAHVFEAWRGRELTGLPTFVRANGGVARAMVGGWLRATTVGDRVPPEGSGIVHRNGIRPVATCTVAGRTTSVPAVCPHLYGIVRWNDAEKSWDCPLHGSRFTADGRVLEGPATRPLAP